MRRDPENYGETEEELEEAYSIASAKYCNENLEIDHPVVASCAEDGCWVRAWVWVPRPEREVES